MASKLIIIIVIIILTGCSSFGPQPDNTKPMYGEVPKNEYYQEIDRKFIQ